MSQTAKTFRLALKVLGESVVVEGPQPRDPLRLDEALPVFQAIDNAVVDRAIAHQEAAGAKVTCTKGCSACCRAQPVPVTPPEAYALARLVESLPEPRRNAVRENFADRVERLREAHLVDELLERKEDLTAEKARAVAERYFELGLVCPFLENDACGIYAERPFVCRQYLVTSSAEMCADPLHNPIQRIAMPIRAATATLTTASHLLKRQQHTVPLTLALEYDARHRKELEATFPASDVFPRWLQALAPGANET